jgi:hypothetical protein
MVPHAPLPFPDRTKASRWLRAVASAWGALSLYLAATWSIDLGMVGFPDGYITPYARATSTPLHVLAAACALQALCFLAWGALGRNLTPGRLLVGIVSAAVVTVAPVLVLHACPQSQACGAAYQALTGEMMDDGAGG